MNLENPEDRPEGGPTHCQENAGQQRDADELADVHARMTQQLIERARQHPERCGEQSSDKSGDSARIPSSADRGDEGANTHAAEVSGEREAGKQHGHMRRHSALEQPQDGRRYERDVKHYARREIGAIRFR